MTQMLWTQAGARVGLLRALVFCCGIELGAFAAPTTYQEYALVSDEPGVGRFTDPDLLNAWDMVEGPGGQWIVTAAHSGSIRFYTKNWQPISTVVQVRAPGGGLASPTGLGVNKWRRGFVIGDGTHGRPSDLVVATEDGVIAGWNREVNPTEAVTLIDNSASGASYKGLAVFRVRGGAQIAAANFGQGVVEFYDSALSLVKSVTETSLANAGYVPFGVKEISGRVFVTYAFKASPSDGDETPGPGLGHVVEFDTAGNIKRVFASQGKLNAPWGLAQAPGGFGAFGGALLVGNFGDGAINAYNMKTGTFLGQLTRKNGTVVQVDGLWSIVRGGSGLYFAAGPDDEAHGLLGVVLRNRAPGGGY